MVNKKTAAMSKPIPILIMSIKPKYAKAIYAHEKNWEFRKAPPPLYKRILIYESAPVSAVTGEVIFSESIRGLSLSVFDLVKHNKTYTRNLPGISLLDLEDYARKSLVSALRVCSVVKYDKPCPLSITPPQNWGRYYFNPESAKSKTTNPQGATK